MMGEQDPGAPKRNATPGGTVMEAHPLSPWSEAIVGGLLVVHDDPAFRYAVRRVLGEVGYAVVECSDTSEALLRALRGEEYGLILCDVDAPRGAVDFHDRMAAMNPEMAARVVFLAGEDVEIPLSNPRIAKPFSTDDLRTWVIEFMSLQTQRPLAR